MAGEKTFLRLPPDSTGKRVKMKHTAQIAYTNKTVGYSWKLYSENYVVTGGWTFHIHSVFEETSTSGILEVHYSRSAVYSNINAAAGSDVG